MKIIEKEVVAEYVNFLKQYYPITDLKLCVVEVGEDEWRTLYTAIRKGCSVLEKMVNEKILDHKTSEIHESHGTGVGSYRDAIAYYIPTVNLVPITRMWKDSEPVQTFRKLLEDTEFFIMLRKRELKNQIQYLDAIFHEILHTIEDKTQIRIFRGSTIQQEERDTKEIVLPYVKEFIKQHKGSFY